MSGGIRTLVCQMMPELEVALYTDRLEMIGALAERGVLLPPGDGAEGKAVPVTLDGSLCVFVLLDVREDRPLHARLGLLAHEAVHAAQFYFDDLGEGDPGDEEFAYAVGAVSSALFDDYLRLVGHGG